MSDTPRVDAIITGNSDVTNEEYEDLAYLARTLERENAAMRAGITEAYKIIDVLYMDALDNHKESWPRAREWMEQWKEVAK